MAEVVLFHHVQGLTPGVVAFAERLRQAGHAVHTPDLLDGRVFDSIDAGMAYVDEVGFERVIERGVAAAEKLPPAVVYAGFSLGVLPAQKLAQTRAGARGAVLMHACVPPETFGSPWPDGLPVQIHGMDHDPFFAGEGDIDAARELVEAEARAELFVYPGSAHLFADASLDEFDPDAAEQVVERVLRFLADLDR